MKTRIGKKKGKKIFYIFLIPILAVMLLQSLVAIGTLVVRQTSRTLDAYSSSMMSRLAENRKVVLQNDMNQRWASVHQQETHLNSLLDQFLLDKKAEIPDLLDSPQLRSDLLELLFPECLDILRGNSTTGIFLVLAGTDIQAPGEFDGFFVRDSDPNSNPPNSTDLLLERGGKQLSRTWNVPLDTNWTTRFHMDGLGQNAADAFFYEPWRAGAQYPDAATVDLGYWSAPFSLEKDIASAYEMITYSLPLRYKGQVYGVLGVETSCQYLYDYFPVTELNASQQSGYMLAVRKGDGSYVSLTGRGVLYNLLRSTNSSFTLKKTNKGGLLRVQDIDLNGEGIYAVECPLKLYSNNVPYEDTEWVLLGLNTEKELFGMSGQLYIGMLISILVGLICGAVCISFLVKHLTRPIQSLMKCIGKGRAGLQEFRPSRILEIDALYDVVTDLTERQKEAENVLLEEKERYRMALESSKDVFYSYDLRHQTLTIVNHRSMSGEWQWPQTEYGLMNPEYIYETDRAAARQAMVRDSDNLYVEFRMRWPDETEFTWVALTGKAIYDTDGQRWKMVGSIRNIQEQKDREAEQLRKNTLDGATGLYVFSVGLELLKERRKQQSEGVMVNLFLARLQENNEKNGILFGDMVLEEVGALLREECGRLERESGLPTVALRLNRDEFVLWLEGQPKKQAAKFAESLLEKISAAFEKETFGIQAEMGLAGGEWTKSAVELIRMAKLARFHAVPGTGHMFAFYADVPEADRADLPALRESDVNTISYNENVKLVSIALDLLGKGTDFPAQMALLIRKIGRFYHAEGVLVSLLQADFNSSYLNYQWHQDGSLIAESVRKYREIEKEAFFRWLGQDEARYFSAEDSRLEMVQCFLSIAPGQKGILLPLYDFGCYMGNVCILGMGPELLEDPDQYQDLAELGRVIQAQLNQRQHDIASKAKSEFLSRMSHEIRTPMNGIIGMTAIALQQSQSPERMLDCLQKIQSSSSYLLALINDILDMSKIESGKMKLEPVHFHIAEMFGTIRELIMPQAETKQVHFTQDITLSHNCFLADRVRISQVLINLLGNAVKFTPPQGSVTLTVREVSCTEEEALIFFAVRDTGIGIAKEDHDRVFRSFEQASGTNPAKHQGTGLGLSISSRLVQMMGSNIQLESAPGVGSTFSFSIPLTIGQDIETQSAKKEISLNGCRILVVEDNEVNSEIAQCLLEDRGADVDCVYDGAQAVERIRATQPGTYDVILMDIMMPVMNGLDATRAIRAMDREDCRTIPIIAMSANAFDDDLRKSVECGMSGHLSKPVEVEKLYQTLDEVVRKNRK